MKKSMLMLMIVTVISGCSVHRRIEGNYNPADSNRSETYSGCKNEMSRLNKMYSSAPFIDSLENCMKNSGYNLRSQTGLEYLTTFTILLPFSTLSTLAGKGLFIDYYVPFGQNQDLWADGMTGPRVDR